MGLKAFNDMIAKQAFGITKKKALERGVCINCGKPPVFKDEVDKREYQISAICGDCWDVITKEEE